MLDRLIALACAAVMAAGCSTPADLDLYVTGDPGHVTAVLAAASTLALD